jgi:hypothetical protein
LNLFRLEEEEHGRQKLQIERVQFEGKIKNFEDIVASQQNDLAKVKENHLFRRLLIVLFFCSYKKNENFLKINFKKLFINNKMKGKN